jgi:hypothetical protein
MLQNDLYKLTASALDNLLQLVLESKTAVQDLEMGPQMVRRLENVVDYLVKAQATLLVGPSITEPALLDALDHVTESKDELAKCWKQLVDVTAKNLAEDIGAEIAPAFHCLSAAVAVYNAVLQHAESLRFAIYLRDGCPKSDRQCFVKKFRNSNISSFLTDMLKKLERDHPEED